MSSIIARRITEEYIGRLLFNENIISLNYPTAKLYEDVKEIVHHINRDRTDNRPENLYVFRNSRHHVEYHNNIRKWAFALCGKTFEEKVVYLKSFPDLKSNLKHLKSLKKKRQELSEYK